ncbi:MAG: hypothetical protein ABI724_09665 [Betaproteobacteria bacterium]
MSEPLGRTMVIFRSESIFAVLAAFVLLVLDAGPVTAASVAPLDLDQIVARSQQIVHVRCIGNQSQSDPVLGVVTVSSFVVLDRAKGAAGSTLTVRQAGGELNGLAVDYHVPKFGVGDEYVLFMPAPSKLGLASPVGLAQGAFGVGQGRSGKEVGNGRDFAVLLAGVDAATVPRGMTARLQQAPASRTRVDLGDFMSLLRARAAKP